MTAVFGLAVAALLANGPALTAPDPIAVLIVLAYAVAARAEFPIGSGHMVPTQLFLIPLFVVAPVALVPALVYAGLAIGLVGEVVLRRSRADRLVYCGGDAMHALGPAVVLALFAGGEPLTAPAAVLALAFGAQLTLDFVSSSLHDRLVFGTRPELHVRVVLQVWAVDAVLTPIGLLAAAAVGKTPWAALAPLPLVALLSAMSADRSRRIAQAWERLEALNRERHRREAAVQRVGEALASNLDLDGLLELVGRAATEALDGERGRAVAVPGFQPPPGAAGRLLADGRAARARRRARAGRAGGRRHARGRRRDRRAARAGRCHLGRAGDAVLGRRARAARLPLRPGRRVRGQPRRPRAAARGRGAAAPPGLPRRPHRAAEPRAVRRPRRPRAQPRDARAQRAGGRLHRPRRLQARQRHARPRRRRRAARRERGADPRVPAPGRHRGAARRRRVRGPARGPRRARPGARRRRAAAPGAARAA